MKYAARMNEANKINSYTDAMMFFAKRFLNSNREADAREFTDKLGGYIEDSDFPCDKIVFDFVTGSAYKFIVILYDNGEKICWLKLAKMGYCTLKIDSFGYEKKECRKYHDLLIEMIKKWNKHIFDNACKVARIKPLEENHIKVEEYVDKCITKTYVLDGTLENIFDDFTSMNRHVTYVNGHFFRFEDERIETIYDLFVRLYDGNFFLDNAVKAGCIID